MPGQSQAMHHLSLRERIHKFKEPYPNSDKLIRFADKAVVVVGVVGPIMAIPQVLKIWVEKNAAGVSITSFTAFMFVSLIWLAYGLLHRYKPIIITQSIWICMHALIVIGINLYG